jgi:hypothetical protein
MSTTLATVAPTKMPLTNVTATATKPSTFTGAASRSSVAVSVAGAAFALVFAMYIG